MVGWVLLVWWCLGLCFAAWVVCAEIVGRRCGVGFCFARVVIRCVLLVCRCGRLYMCWRVAVFRWGALVACGSLCGPRMDFVGGRLCLGGLGGVLYARCVGWEALSVRVAV